MILHVARSYVTWNIIPRKTAFSGGFKGPSQRRAAALPSESLMGRWSTPTTGALSKATPRAARRRFLWRSIEMLSDPGIVVTRVPKPDRFGYMILHVAHECIPIIQESAR